MKFKLADIGEGITSAEIVKWHAKQGDRIGVDEPLVDVETDKAIVTLPSPVKGVLTKIVVEKGEVNVGAVLADIKETGKRKSVSVVGDIEEEHEKTGDIIIPLDKKKTTKITAKKTKRKYTLYGHVERTALEGVRKTIAKHMVESASTIPHVTHMDMIDVTAVKSERENYKQKHPDVKITYLPFIIRAVVNALKKFPRLNASLGGEEIILKKYYNIGIAVATENGLLVPVIKRADQKDIVALAEEIFVLAASSRDRSIDLADLQGGTFTITNIGSTGGVYFTPIINHPESAILGLGRIQKQNGRYLLPVSVSFDHRILDGEDAARFINECKEQLS